MLDTSSHPAPDVLAELRRREMNRRMMQQPPVVNLPARKDGVDLQPQAAPSPLIPLSIPAPVLIVGEAGEPEVVIKRKGGTDIIPMDVALRLPGAYGTASDRLVNRERKRLEKLHAGKFPDLEELRKGMVTRAEKYGEAYHFRAVLARLEAFARLESLFGELRPKTVQFLDGVREKLEAAEVQEATEAREKAEREVKYQRERAEREARLSAPASVAFVAPAPPVEESVEEELPLVTEPIVNHIPKPRSAAPARRPFGHMEGCLCLECRAYERAQAKRASALATSTSPDPVFLPEPSAGGGYLDGYVDPTQGIRLVSVRQSGGS